MCLSISFLANVLHSLWVGRSHCRKQTAVIASSSWVVVVVLSNKPEPSIQTALLLCFLESKAPNSHAGCWIFDAREVRWYNFEVEEPLHQWRLLTSVMTSRVDESQATFTTHHKDALTPIATLYALNTSQQLKTDRRGALTGCWESLVLIYHNY